MERSYSLGISSPRLTNPIADSTWIESKISGSRATALQLKKSLSPRQNNNTSIVSLVNGTSPQRTLDSTTSSLHQASLNTSGANSSRISRQKLNLSQLDPKYILHGNHLYSYRTNPNNCIARTYADVHSSGLTARIVQYQQESRGGLQRSMSFNNVYKPLSPTPRRSISTTPSRLSSKKPNLPSLAITRIAPPEQSFYCGNTLPSLLRSNSLLGVEKSSEQVSRENRPIMHPQSMHHESEPTRSVLDELKEISRKRINSGDIQQHDYTGIGSKKSCSRMTDYVDHHLTHQQLAQQHHHAQQQQQHHQAQQSHPYWPTIPVQAQCFKRQRELSVAVPLRYHHLPVVNVPQQHSHQHQQQQHQQHQQQLLLQQKQQQLQQLQQQHQHQLQLLQQKSPEQLAKRRNCSYSNDITSSLSSSRSQSNKRKTLISPDTSPSQQNAAKIQRKQATNDLRLEPLTQTQSMPPITPLPATPAQRTVSAPTLLEEPVASPTASKPKLTLFNAQQQEQQQQDQKEQKEQTQQQKQLDLDSPDVEAGEYAGIQFVQPKQEYTTKGVRNSNLERMQKTKLASLLSSLKGEIYLGEDADEPDMTLKEKTTTTAVTAKVTAAATATSIVATPTKLTAPTTTTATIATVTTTTTTTPTISTATVTTNATTTTTSPKAATTTNNALPLLTFNQTTTTTSAATPTTTASGVGGFTSFTLPTTSNISVITANTSKATTTTTASQIPLASATTTTSSILAPITTTALATPMFTFGNATSKAPAAAAATTAPTTTAASAPMFSFGTVTTAATPAATPAATLAQAATTVSTGTPLLSFGSPAVTVTVTATPSVATTTTVTMTATPTADKLFSFGNPAAVGSNSNSAATTTAPTIAMNNWTPKPIEMGGFNSGSNNNTPSFGGAFKPAAATATPAPTVAEPQKLFSFGGASAATTKATPAATPAPTAAEPQKLFSFGGASAATTKATPAAPVATPMFGSATTATSVFSFGTGTAAAADTASKPATDGATTAPGTAAAPLFAFGGAGGDTNTANAAKPSPFTMPSSGNNLFSFGGSGDAKATTTAATAPTNSFSFNATATPAAAAPQAAPAPTNAFSFSASPKPTPIFGGNAANSSSTTAATSKPFTFGALAAAQEQQQQEQQQPSAAGQQRSGGFSFGAAAQKNESSNLFATPAAVTKPSFNFGSSATTTPVAPAAAAPTFGGFAAPAVPANKPFAFGGSATPATNASAAAGTGATSAPSMGGNLFASAVAAVQQQQPKPASFNFGSANNNNASNNNNNGSSGTNAPFSFGGISSTPQSSNTAKPFAFGASATPSAQAGNIFGSPAAPQATLIPSTNGGAFNFTGAAKTAGAPATPQQMNSGNLFAPPSTPENRPMRRATRRLQK